MPKEKRKMIERTKELSLYDLDDVTPDQVREWLSDLEDLYGINCKFHIETYWESIDLVLKYESPETDAERNQRLNAERKEREKKAQAKRKKELLERDEYHRLKKKFEEA